MINVKQLRLENLTLHSDGTILTVVGIDPTYCNCTYKGIKRLSIGISYRDIKPIPLTEEWHNKFGVEIDGYISFVYELPRIRNIKIEVVFTGDYVFLRQRNDDCRANDSLVSIWNKDLMKRDMYVHEWQNLYFALTGEELTIKL